MSRQVIPFYFGLGSRHFDLAASQLDRIEGAWPVRFAWFPLYSGELIRRAHGGRSPFDEKIRSGQYDEAYRRRDAEAWASYYGIPYREPKALETDPPDLAKVCWAADKEGRLEAMSRRLFQAIFVEGLVLSRRTLASFAADVGLNGAELTAALDAPDVVSRHEAALAQALDDGAFGVPSFVVAGQVFWGNDRLPLVEHALAKLSTEA